MHMLFWWFAKFYSTIQKQNIILGCGLLEYLDYKRCLFMFKLLFCMKNLTTYRHTYIARFRVELATCGRQEAKCSYKICIRFSKFYVSPRQDDPPSLTLCLGQRIPKTERCHKVKNPLVQQKNFVNISGHNPSWTRHAFRLVSSQCCWLYMAASCLANSTKMRKLEFFFYIFIH